MEQFWRDAARLAATSQPALLATVMAVSGNIPAPPGARLLVTADETAGELDGGPADSVVVPRLRQALGSAAFTERVVISSEIAQAFRLLQGGAVDLLVQPLTDFAPGMLDAVAAVVNAGDALLLVTPLLGEGEPLRPGRPALVRNGAASGSVPDGLLADAAALTAAGQSVRWTAGASAAFVDVVRPADELVIFGATLMAEELCALAARAGFRVSLIDDNPAVRDRYPAAAEVIIASDPVAALVGRRHTPSTYVVSMTTGHRFDLTAVEELLRQPLRYLGMMGSRGRVARVMATLRENGFTDNEIARLHAPLGLNIGAETPFEIAVAIMAELVQVRRGQTGPVSEWGVPAAAGAPA